MSTHPVFADRFASRPTVNAILATRAQEQLVAKLMLESGIDFPMVARPLTTHAAAHIVRTCMREISRKNGNVNA